MSLIKEWYPIDGETFAYKGRIVARRPNPYKSVYDINDFQFVIMDVGAISRKTVELKDRGTVSFAELRRLDGFTHWLPLGE